MGAGRFFAIAACVLAGVLGGAAQAAADGVPAADLHVAQTLGDRELTVVIRAVEPVPGPLLVEVVTHAGTRPGPLALRVSASGASSGAAGTPSEAVLELGARPGPHAATLRVDRPGPWELAIDDGERVARIPFVVPERVVSAWEKAAYGGFVGAGGLMLVTVVVAARARRGWVALVPAGGVVAALAVGVTAALLSSSIPPPSPAGALTDPVDGRPVPRLSSMDYSRPPVNLVVRTGEAAVGKPLDIRLSLTDTGSGRPADDLLVRDNAFIHLVVVGPTGRLWHLHPIRTAPGEYSAPIIPPAPGEYALAAELSRRGGGVQLVRSAFRVGSGTTEFAPVPGPGVRDVDGTRVEVTATGLTTASTSTITARFGDTADLQPWLGMLGHLIVVGPLDGPAADAPVWAHVHAMVPAGLGAPDETVAAFGPEVSFGFRFPAPGRYRLWVQAERGYAVLTAPVDVTVGAGR